ncbi:MAG: hypothetical protein JW850_13500 [Thermoflexales bacterium]|nr:hypothetical protein [Thermoflexales bacterium]
MIEPSILRTVISNTGPLISAFQSRRIDILRQFYDVILIPNSELPEFEEHGAADEIDDLIETGFVIVHTLTDAEKPIAQEIAQAIANSPLSKNKEAAHHYSEAEAIVLMSRPELSAQEILLDELAARQIAQARGIHVVGFAGILIRACQQQLLAAEDVRDTLMLCQQQGTHYSDRFITEIYTRLTEG